MIHMHFYGSQVELYVAGYDRTAEEIYGCYIWTNQNAAHWGRYNLSMLRWISSEAGEPFVRNVQWKECVSSSVVAIKKAYHERGWWSRYP